MVVLALLGDGGGGEDHGAGLDAAHLDGLEVAHDDDLAALHLLEGNEAVEAGADGAADLALVLGVVVVAGGVADGNGGDVEGVGVGVVDGLEDVADSEVDEGGGERSSRGGSLLGLGGLLLLLLLLASTSSGSTGGGTASDLLLDIGGNLLDLFHGTVDERGLGVAGGGLGLLLLKTLLLSLGVDGGLHVEDIVLIDLELILVLDLEPEQGRVLDKVEVTNNVRVALFASALLGSPAGNDGGEALVDGDIGLAGLAAEEGSSAREVVVESLENGRLVLGRLEALRGGQPLLDLGLLGGSIRLGGEGRHSGELSEGGESPSGDGTKGAEGEQGC